MPESQANENSYIGPPRVRSRSVSWACYADGRMIPGTGQRHIPGGKCQSEGLGCKCVGEFQHPGPHFSYESDGTLHQWTEDGDNTLGDGIGYTITPPDHSDYVHPKDNCGRAADGKDKWVPVPDSECIELQIPLEAQKRNEESHRLQRRASQLMGYDSLPWDHFLSRAIVWAGQSVADFCLKYHDFDCRWVGQSINFEDVYGATAHECMARIVITHHESTAPTDEAKDG